MLPDDEGYYLATRGAVPSQLVAINIKRMTDLIDTAEDGNSWEQEAKAEMQKAIAALASQSPSARGDK